VVIENTGNAWNEIDLSQGSSPYDWNARFRQADTAGDTYAEELMIGLNSGENATIAVRIDSGSSVEYGQVYSVVVNGDTRNGSETRSLTFNMTITSPAVVFSFENNHASIPRGSSGNITAVIENAGASELNFTFDASGDLPLYVEVILYRSDYSEPGASRQLNVSVPGGGNATFFAFISVGASATLGEKTIQVDVYYLGVWLTALYMTIDVT
jgi:uncharacterized membrane protein